MSKCRKLKIKKNKIIIRQNKHNTIRKRKKKECSNTKTPQNRIDTENRVTQKYTETSGYKGKSDICYKNWNNDKIDILTGTEQETNINQEFRDGFKNKDSLDENNQSYNDYTNDEIGFIENQSISENTHKLSSTLNPEINEGDDERNETNKKHANISDTYIELDENLQQHNVNNIRSNNNIEKEYNNLVNQLALQITQLREIDNYYKTIYKNKQEKINNLNQKIREKRKEMLKQRSSSMSRIEPTTTKTQLIEEIKAVTADKNIDNKVRSQRVRRIKEYGIKNNIITDEEAKQISNENTDFDKETYISDNTTNKFKKPATPNAKPANRSSRDINKNLTDNNNKTRSNNNSLNKSDNSNSHKSNNSSLNRSSTNNSRDSEQISKILEAEEIADAELRVINKRLDILDKKRKLKLMEQSLNRSTSSTNSSRSERKKLRNDESRLDDFNSFLDENSQMNSTFFSNIEQPKTDTGVSLVQQFNSSNNILQANNNDSRIQLTRHYMQNSSTYIAHLTSNRDALLGPIDLNKKSDGSHDSLIKNTRSSNNDVTNNNEKMEEDPPNIQDAPRDNNDTVNPLTQINKESNPSNNPPNQTINAQVDTSIQHNQIPSILPPPPPPPPTPPLLPPTPPSITYVNSQDKSVIHDNPLNQTTPSPTQTYAQQTLIVNPVDQANNTTHENSQIPQNIPPHTNNANINNKKQVSFSAAVTSKPTDDANKTLTYTIFLKLPNEEECNIELLHELSTYKPNLNEDNIKAKYVSSKKISIQCTDMKIGEYILETWDTRAFSKYGGIEKVERYEGTTRWLHAYVPHIITTREEDWLKNKYNITSIEKIGPSDYKMICADQGNFNIIMTNGFIKAGLLVIKVKQWQTKPIVEQCFKCQQFGHKTKLCTKALVCKYCSCSHDSNSCARKNISEWWICINCGGRHHAGSKKCKVYVELLENQQRRMQNKSQPTKAKSTNQTSLLNESDKTNNNIDCTTREEIEKKYEERLNLVKNNLEKKIAKSIAMCSEINKAGGCERIEMITNDLLNTSISEKLTDAKREINNIIS